MRVSLNDIREKFDALVTNSQSREEIASYASDLMIADDESRLIMEPDYDTDKIWKSIVYLTGVDFQEEPGEYLHSNEDFVAFRTREGI